MALPWEAFAALEGSPNHNLELLCRGVVQRNYGRFGQLRSRRNQPGIEFHLKLETGCDLGEAGRWFGWQCRWYELPKDLSLGNRRRAEILKAIASAKADVDGLTDFILCLRELPRKADLEWYFGLDVGLHLGLWADEEIETRLTGDAEILRRTYFGELVLSADQLAETQARTIAPVQQRWIPDLNVTTSVEDAIRIALAQPGRTGGLRGENSRLNQISDALKAAHGEIGDTDLQSLAAAVGADVVDVAERLKGIADACDLGRPQEAWELVTADARPKTTVPDVRRLARRLRAQRTPVALIASTVEADVRHALSLIANRRRLMTSHMIAVVGDAGRGKTQLAGQLTAPSSSSPAGIFLRGFDLRAGGTLDELASRLPGIHASTFDELLEAADAAGARLGARIPIVVDGLNDAERPAEWRIQLAQVIPILDRYDYVLLIVTVRGAVQEEVLPEGAQRLELKWDRTEVQKIVARYFTHYRIDPGASRMPIGLFSIPLFVRLFCEAVNPDRTLVVGVEALPASLVAVFDLYRIQTAKRLRTRPGHPTVPPGHIEKKLARFAQELWRERVRELSFERTRELIDEPSGSWDDSLVRALEEEGVVFRDSSTNGTVDRSAVLFDRFAGFLIADAITGGLTMDGLADELASADLWARLHGPPNEQHPLADDVLIALVGLIPRRFYGRQLWRLAPEDARDWALIQVVDLESGLLDRETIDALEQLVQRLGPPRWDGERHPFDRLWEVRDGVDHQLNARFMDHLLRSMPVADRDLAWTEWTRTHAEDLLRDLDELEAQWVAVAARDDADDLNARAVAWLLTSTVLPLRDRATRALQRYGRPDPSRLFALASDLLDINDPYVAERLLAASFGAAMTHQMPDPDGQFERGLHVWLEELDRRYLRPDAASPTSHQLARQYVSGCFELARQLHRAALPNTGDPEVLTFASGPEPESIGSNDDRESECNETFGMDYTNYIVGPLYEGRSNYQMDHPHFLAGLAQVRGRVWDLGWRSTAFSEIDKRIASDQWRPRVSSYRTERYGKKYGWIAFYELAGRLADRGELRDRTWTAGRGVWPDIDPTFPEVPPRLRMQLPAWASSGPADNATWCSKAHVEVPNELLITDTLNDQVGPWVLVEGFLEHHDPELGRRVWGMFRGVLATQDDAAKLKSQLKARPYLGNRFVPDPPADHDTFAGEIPWSARFAAAGDLENDRPPYRANVSERWDEPGIEVELLGHGYELEASRTTTNQASGFWVPSHNLASQLGLRQRPGTLDLVSLDGHTASLTLASPANFKGKLLYIRRDLLALYAAGRLLVQLAWGERQVDFDWPRPPQWLNDVRSRHKDLWRHVAVLKP